MLMLQALRDFLGGGVPGYRYRFLSLYGYTATHEFTRFVPNKGGRWFVHSQMFRLPRTTYRKVLDPNEYVGMWTWVLLDPDAKWGAFERSDCNGAFEEHNRTLLRSRATPCPMNYVCSCLRCYRGLESCERGTHPANYMAHPCPRCEVGNAMFKDEKDPLCVSCTERERIAKKYYAVTKGRTPHGDANAPQGNTGTV
jgi:hypothetical protein